MLTPESCTWKLGRFTVRQALRADNPAFAQYMVFVGDKLIGKSFSMPDQGCCEWLERQHRLDRITYAEASAQPKVQALRGVAVLRRGRPRKASTLALELDTEPA